MGNIGIGGVSAVLPQPQPNLTPEQAVPTTAPAEVTTTSQEEQDLQTLLSQEEEETKSLIEMMKEAREQAEEQRKALQKFYKDNNNIRYGDAPLEAYARLARAKNRTQINAASGYAHRRIAQLKRALHQDSDNATSIRGAISQLQKAINRGEKKKRDLDREALLETRRARSEREKKSQQEQRLRLELLRRKSQRMIREAGYMREAEIDSRFRTQAVQTQLEMRQQIQEITATSGVSLETAIQQYTASAAPEAPAPAISIES